MAANDLTSYGRKRSTDEPAIDLIAVVPHDVNDLAAIPRGLYVGVAGDVTVITVAGVTVVITAQVGVLPFACIKRVKATGTTATGLIAIY